MCRSGHVRTIFLMLFLVLRESVASAGPYTGFQKLNPKECAPADDRILSHLPRTWDKFRGFVKICDLKRDGRISDISIISIWEQEYFEHFQRLGNVPVLEPFPLPVIVNKELVEVGNLPEVYPVDDITSQVIYYGKWCKSVPTEILVDVHNPAEGGDYHYRPIIYNWGKAKYEIRQKEIIDGRRR